MKVNVEIIEFREELSEYFAELNLAWLKKYFVVEPLDKQMLAEPKKYIIDTGGYIFFATVNGEVAGTFALKKLEDGIFKLSKMAVAEAFQGKGIGNEIMKFCIEEAARLHANKIILLSNTKLQPAIHLYHKYGFVEVPLENAEFERANIRMELVINSNV